MPHVIVKLHAGRSEQLKTRLADEICKAVMSVLKCDADSVSVGVEDIAPRDWADTVYKPDIRGGRGKIYKQPGYDPPE